MCTLCSDLGVQTDECWTVDPVIQAAVAEDPTASASITTTNVMGPGDVFNGVRSNTSDDDYIRVTLEANMRYTIDLEGLESYYDTYMYVRGSDGSILYEDDDSGDGYGSQVVLETTTGGDYYIQVSAYAFHIGTGAYAVTVTSGESINTGPISTLDQMANFLTDGYWGGNDRSYNTGPSNDITVNLSALTAEGQQLARWAMEAWELVADIEFIETTGSASMVFEDDGSGAYASSSYFRGDIQSSSVNVSSSWISSYGSDIGSYTFQTYIHEIGHALGLGHQGSYNGSANYANDADFAEDSWQMSVMSYFSQSQNTSTNASHANVTSAQMVDILAIQNLYGESTVTAGDDVWGGTDSTIGTYLDALFDSVATGTDPQNIFDGGSVAYTIFDHSGNDTIDFSYSSHSDNVNLNGESFSNVGGLTGNVGIARGTVIENLKTGSGNDTVTGNSADNAIWGNDGSDDIAGKEGSDTIVGGNGNDNLHGGDGQDILQGGSGNDTLEGGAGSDTADGGSGHDRLWVGGGDDFADGGEGNDGIGGWAGNDVLNGGQGNDTLRGGDGNDTLDGGDDADLIWGGTGNDSILASSGNDTIGGGAGKDVIFGGTGANVINGGSSGDELHGGAGNDTLKGGRGNDELNGGEGDDLLDGGKDKDIITGGSGLDIFSYENNSSEDFITDFTLGQDTLRLNDNLWSGANTAASVVSNFATVGEDGVTFDFGDGDILTLGGLTSTSGLDAHIDIF
ncbi:MAG: M10 family metallopeptidase C-terminal domain-containing protein [Paracoccaceae bacterium]